MRINIPKHTLLVFFSVTLLHVPLLIHAQTLISTSFGAGSTTGGSSGDGGAATSALLLNPSGLAIAANGDTYICDSGNHKIRKITNATGIASTIAGTGTGSYTGDGGLATAATLNNPTNICINSAGDLLIADANNHVVRKITTSTGIITTVAGTGTGGDQVGVATSSRLKYPKGVAVDASDNIYICDEFNNKIKKVTVSTGNMAVYAGTGTNGYSGDGAAATSAKINGPYACAFNAAGDLFFVDNTNAAIRKISISTGFISTVAGKGTNGYTGDGAAATAAELANPRGIAVDQTTGDFYISDANSEVIRKVTISTGFITTVAGVNSANPAQHTGDGGVATSAQTGPSRGVAVSSSKLVFTEYDNHAVRVVTGLVIPLPVQLIDFTVQENQGRIQLSWKTTMEENCANFNVMRSDDGIHFDKIGVVPAHGQSNIPLKYHYTDLIPLKKGIYYYQLIENDWDGKSQSSKIVVMSFEEKNDVHIFPNPNVGKAGIFFHSIEGGVYTINILDQNGVILYTQEFIGNKGANEYEVDMAHLNSGMYHVQFNGPEYKYAVLKVLKKQTEAYHNNE
ncbi:MAG: hypothetical protein RL060_438 [Bacteroidota bacterium]